MGNGKTTSRRNGKNIRLSEAEISAEEKILNGRKQRQLLDALVAATGVHSDRHLLDEVKAVVAKKTALEAEVSSLLPLREELAAAREELFVARAKGINQRRVMDRLHERLEKAEEENAVLDTKVAKATRLATTAAKAAAKAAKAAKLVRETL
ncbi:hypothetical protein HKX48_008220 [Thoreauomyces humboldtii]|nr:hypothetical protein HKX48_008220 [Thoreauomyces humboldtii]